MVWIVYYGQHMEQLGYEESAVFDILVDIWRMKFLYEKVNNFPPQILLDTDMFSGMILNLPSVAAFHHRRPD